MDILIIPEADQHIGFAGHAGMDRVLAQEAAKDPVTGIGRLAADDITGIDILQVDLQIQPGKMGLDLFDQKGPDIAQSDVSRRILS